MYEYKIKRKYLFLGSLLLYFFCIVSFPVSLYSQALESPTSFPSFDNSGEESQKGDMEDFFVRYNGCSWLRMPYNPLCDITLELKDKMLILYRYLKDGAYCHITSTVCFVNWELLRIQVKGYNMVLIDQKGNEYQVIISRDWETITITGKDNLGFSEDVLGTFVKFYCTGNR